MTLKEAQEQWDDAVQLNVIHKPFSVTGKMLIDAAGGYGERKIKPLYMKIGKTSSRIIWSEKAAVEEGVAFI